MADTGANIAGSVTVQIGGSLGPLQAALAQAEQMTRAFDARVASALGSSGAGAAMAKVDAAVAETGATLAAVTAPAAAAAATIDKVGTAAVAAAVGTETLGGGLSSATISASAMARALELTGGNLSKVTPEMLGLAAANDAVAASTLAVTETTAAAAVSMGALGVAEAETAGLGAGVSREFSVLGAEVLRGNFSRIPGSLLVMNERLASTGTSVLTLKNVLGGLGALGSVIFNPFIAGFLAITIGADLLVKFFEHMHGPDEKQAEEALQRQKQLVLDIAAAFPVAGKALDDYLKEANKLTPNVGISKLEDDAKAAQKQFEVLAKQINAVVLAASDPMRTTGGAGTISGLFKFDPSAYAQVKTFVSEFDAGTITARKLGDELAGIKISPELPASLRGAVQSLIDMAEKGGDVQGVFNGMTDAANKLRTAISDFDVLGKPDMGAAFTADNLAKSVQSKSKYQIDLDAITALSPAQKADIARRREALSLDGQDISQSLRAQQIQQAGALAYAQAIHSTSVKASSAFETTTDSILKQTAALNAETASYGKSTSEVEAAKVQQQLLTAAQQDHLALTPKLINQINAMADAYGRAAQASRLAAVNDNAMFDRSQLGRSDTEQGIAATLRDAVGGGYADLMNGPTASILRMNAALQQSKDLATSFGSTLVSDFSQGKSVTDSLSDAFGSLGQQLLQIALNQAIAALFSNLTGGNDNKGWGQYTGNSGGNILSSIGHIFGFADGTSSAPGGVALVGERGPELVQLPQGARVNTASQTSAMLQGAGGTTVNLGGIVVNAAPGQDPMAIASATATKVLDVIHSRFPAAVQDVIDHPRSRGKQYFAT